MPSKEFERVVRFFEIALPTGQRIWLPLVEVTLITVAGSRVLLNLLFDTGASTITLRDDLFPFLGLQSWDQGQKLESDTAGGKIDIYKYDAMFEVFGKTINCPVHLARLTPNPFFVGLFGRDTIFSEFGFAFWESTHELLITATP